MNPFPELRGSVRIDILAAPGKNVAAHIYPQALRQSACRHCASEHMDYELLEHPADIGFRTRGATLAELFVNCARALVAIIMDASAASAEQSVAINATAADRESLLVNWLNEVLYFTDGRRLALATFDITHLDDTRIDCTARGEPRDARRHPPLLCVKAVTYHQLQVVREPDAWRADVYLDI